MKIDIEELKKEIGEDLERSEKNKDNKKEEIFKKDTEIILILKDIYENKKENIDKMVLNIEDVDELKNYSIETVNYAFPLTQTFKYIGKITGVEGE